MRFSEPSPLGMRKPYEDAVVAQASPLVPIAEITEQARRLLSDLL